MSFGLIAILCKLLRSNTKTIFRSLLTRRILLPLEPKLSKIYSSAQNWSTRTSGIFGKRSKRRCRRISLSKPRRRERVQRLQNTPMRNGKQYINRRYWISQREFEGELLSSSRPTSRQEASHCRTIRRKTATVLLLRWSHCLPMPPREEFQSFSTSRSRSTAQKSSGCLPFFLCDDWASPILRQVPPPTRPPLLSIGSTLRPRQA